MFNLNDDIRYLTGIGEKRAKCLAKLGIHTVNDLLNFYPRDYEYLNNITPIREANEGEKVCIKAQCISPVTTKTTRSALKIFTAQAADSSGIITITIFGSKYQADKLIVGNEYLFLGTVKGNIFGKEMSSPKIVPYTSAAGIEPIYPLSAGLNETIMSKAVKTALEKYANTIEDDLPAGLTDAYKLISRREAIKNIHFPQSETTLREAKKRLAFEELLYLQIGLMTIKGRNSSSTSPVAKTDFSEQFEQFLPYSLTGAQKRVISECVKDLADDKPMARLIQGDVGCGKTSVAQSLAFTMAKNGYQTAMMAPTEILARQLYASFTKTLKNTGLKIDILVGSMKAAEKREIKQRLFSGETDIVIGTHTLIQKDIKFNRLGLVITDEQHRFGVVQRSDLAGKGENTNTLVMSATPIPRTLSLIIYGDLDISTIDEMPPGRKKIKTYQVDSTYRKRIYSFTGKELLKGRQAYVVCPMVEEAENENILAAEEYADKLRKVFPEYKVGLVHGKMKGSEKDAVMSDFSEGKINILVATTVIEVGIDVPNATIMIIENAERFGLSTMHQLRGRIGRGEHESYCILVSDSSGEVTKQRMKTLCSTEDGFKISAEDLKLRGPGEFFGERQHGSLNLKTAKFIDDSKVISDTREAAILIAKADPKLTSRKYSGIKKHIDNMFSDIEPNLLN